MMTFNIQRNVLALVFVLCVSVLVLFYANDSMSVIYSSLLKIENDPLDKSESPSKVYSLSLTVSSRGKLFSGQFKMQNFESRSFRWSCQTILPEKKLPTLYATGTANPHHDKFQRRHSSCEHWSHAMVLIRKNLVLLR